MIPNRVVIDTNVCLDLFVFHDKRYQLLLDSLTQGSLQAVTRADCRKEYAFVLTYPHLPLDDKDRAAALERYDALITLLTPEDSSGGIVLPVCKDREDQKFMQLAHDAHASLLITKDKALLKLARRNAKLGLFSILTPDAWQRQQPA